MSEALFQRAVQHHGDGRVAEAVAIYDRLLQDRPDNLAVLPLLAMGVWQTGDAARAETLWQRVLQLNQALPEAHLGLGLILEGRGDWDAAAAAFETAARLDPGNADAHFNLANVRRRQDQWDRAEAAGRAALALDPVSAPGLTSYAAVRLAQGHAAEARAWLDNALALDRALPESWSALGEVETAQGRATQAARCFEQALALRPDFAAARFNLGNALRDNNQLGPAIACFRQALADAGQDEKLAATIRYNLSLALLKQGDLAEGWALYRGRHDSQARASLPQPEWNGAPPSGKLLVWNEQGVGDEILYAGMIPDLIARNMDIVLECDPRLAPLFRRSFPGIRIVERRRPHPHPAILGAGIAAQIAAPDLGALLRPDMSRFPRHSGYLQADPDRVAALRLRYGAGGRRKLVGLSWTSAAAGGVAKSTRLADWSPVLALPDVTFVSLQYGDHARELDGLPVVQDPAIDPLADMDAFAAQVAAMDLVISTSNTTVHVAGALGAPVWTLLPQAQGSLWYWFDGRADSPFYPSMKLYRQRRFGEWRPLFDQVAADLAAFAAAGCAA